MFESELAVKVAHEINDLCFMTRKQVKAVLAKCGIVGVLGVKTGNADKTVQMLAWAVVRKA
jgi:hypothetical protein